MVASIRPSTTASICPCHGATANASKKSFSASPSRASRIEGAK